MAPAGRGARFLAAGSPRAAGRREQASRCPPSPPAAQPGVSLGDAEEKRGRRLAGLGKRRAGSRSVRRGSEAGGGSRSPERAMAAAGLLAPSPRPEVNNGRRRRRRGGGSASAAEPLPERPG